MTGANQKSNATNMQDIYAETRARWLADEAPRVPWAVRLATGVNWSVLIVALAAFGLSAAHTVAVFNVISPGVAWLAPVMIELGLVYVALRARLDARQQARPGGVMLALAGLLVIAAFASNLAGGLTAAAMTSEITGLSAADLVGQFGTLPLKVQAGLFVAVLMAFIVPAAGIVAGEGVAALLFDTRRGETDWIEGRWREVEREVLYRAVFARLNGDGLAAPDAARIAKAEVRAYLSPVDQGRALPASTASSTPSTVSSTVDSSRQPAADKSAAIRAFLAANPDAVGLSVSDLHRLLASNGVDASRALVGRVVRDLRG